MINIELTDIIILRKIIFYLRNKINYQSLYTAFLLGTLSEEEFEEESEKFIVQQKDISVETVASEIKRIHNLAWLDFSISDYADYFQCSQDIVQEALNKISTNG